MVKKEWSSYKIINSILFLLLGVMFIYVGVFYSPGQITCIVKYKTGLECTSCGLTRDFHSILHLSFTELVNAHSVQIFSFFLFQFIVRGALFMWSKERRPVIYIDARAKSHFYFHHFSQVVYVPSGFQPFRFNALFFCFFILE